MIRGVVINVHAHGALVRLEDGSLVAVAAAELARHRQRYANGLGSRAPLDFLLDTRGRHPVVTLDAPAPEPAQAAVVAGLVDPQFEERMGAYLKETEAWAPPDRPAPAERHFIRKKRRAALFEARNKPT